MKKLFFAAALAIVAIGGSLTVSATAFRSNGTSIPCSPGAPFDCVENVSSLTATTPLWNTLPIDATPDGLAGDYSFDEAD